MPNFSSHTRAAARRRGLPFRRLRIALGVLAVVFTAFTTPNASKAASDPIAFSAVEVSRSATQLSADAGGSMWFTISFKNTGTATWNNYGADYASVYTYLPKYRSSVFRDATWRTPVQPVRMQEPVVGPGNIGTFRFQLTAPLQSGTFNEAFRIAVEDKSWVAGTDFTVPVTVNALKPGQSVATPASVGTVVPVVTTIPTTPPPATSVPVAAGAPPWQTTLVSLSPSTVTLPPRGTATVTLTFRNTGSKAWAARGGAYLSLYTYVPKYRASVFAAPSWIDRGHVARINEASVAPGGLATVTVIIAAPAAAGSYREAFKLAAEDVSWIPGSDLVIPITVTSGTSVATSGGGQSPAGTVPEALATPPTENPSGVSAKLAAGYAATKLIASANRLSLSAGGLGTYRVGFKNTGAKTWLANGDTKIGLSADVGNAYSFRHVNWPEPVVAAKLAEDAPPGAIAFFDVPLAAPNAPGAYIPRFVLTAGTESIEGGAVELPIEVTQGAVPASVSNDAPLPSGPRGPDIRVGLFETKSDVTFAATGTYQVVDGANGAVVRTLSGLTRVHFDFDTLRYTVSNGAWSQTFDNHVRLRPESSATIFEIPSYSAVPTWDPTVNFNRFRGDLDVRYARATGKLWVIETLPLEDYMRGLAETSNASPQEYQKALVTAARTFAYFVVSLGGKHQSQNFDVTTTAGDQVYKGYASELVRPNVVRAVEDTRGMLVTYAGEVVVTPYFSRSDGRTRAWNEVWYGSRAWLVSKPAPHDAGQTLWGHGVGMSASDALGRADDGALWQDILRYYYTGVSVEQKY